MVEHMQENSGITGPRSVGRDAGPLRRNCRGFALLMNATRKRPPARSPQAAATRNSRQEQRVRRVQDRAIRATHPHAVRSNGLRGLSEPAAGTRKMSPIAATSAADQTGVITTKRCWSHLRAVSQQTLGRRCHLHCPRDEVERPFQGTFGLHGRC